MSDDNEALLNAFLEAHPNVSDEDRLKVVSSEIRELTFSNASDDVITQKYEELTRCLFDEWDAVYPWKEQVGVQTNSLDENHLWQILSKFRSGGVLNSSNEEEDQHDELRLAMAQVCHEWSLASKARGDLKKYVLSQGLRMILWPSCQTLDAVRLLGLVDVPAPNDDRLFVDERPRMQGLFEVERSQERRSEIRPSLSARALGATVKNLFCKEGFTARNCAEYLVPFMQPGRDETAVIDGKTFFNHRLDLVENSSPDLSGRDFLVRAFLFGIAVRRDDMEKTIGKSQVEDLVRAGLLSASPLFPWLVVAEYQIYPISPEDLGGSNDELCLFMTDWPMQSLRNEVHAVMSIGYDSLELMATTADGWKKGGTLLDMCCGSGVQGIFAATASGCFNRVLCCDLNVRACYVTAANSALNAIDSMVVVQSDLFDSLDARTKCSLILCNPPFVALPLETRGALFADGGIFGTTILERFFRHSMDYLEETGAVLMVSELPNIEDSCDLLRRFLPNNVRVAVSVVYVGSDVEAVTQYADERAKECGVSSGGIHCWVNAQTEATMKNRALAVLAVHKNEEGSALHCYHDESIVQYNEEVESPEDEVDALLSAQGTQFLRTCLL